ncbi:MAG: (2Fe-2S)-binding protein, partial [Pseudomonadota bacterium]
VNGEARSLDLDPEMPLLWALRDVIGLRGSKYGCGVGGCGACTVHVDGAPTLSCVTPVGSLAPAAEITTIEGAPSRETAALLAAWRELDVAQCGFCQPGQIMRASALLAQIPSPNGDQVAAAMEGNLCRCATYPRIKVGIARAAELLSNREAVE